MAFDYLNTCNKHIWLNPVLFAITDQTTFVCHTSVCNWSRSTLEVDRNAFSLLAMRGYSSISSAFTFNSLEHYEEIETFIALKETWINWQIGSQCIITKSSVIFLEPILHGIMGCIASQLGAHKKICWCSSV